jgi:hypothetical protein
MAPIHPYAPLPPPWLRAAVCVPRGFANRRVRACVRVRVRVCVCVCVCVCALSSMLVARCDRMAVAWKAEKRPCNRSLQSARRLDVTQGHPPRPIEGRSSHPTSPRCYYVIYPVDPLFSVSRHVHVQLPETYSSRIDTRCVDILHAGHARGSIRHGSTRGNYYTCAIGEVNPDEGERSGTSLTSSARPLAAGQRRVNFLLSAR